MFRRSPYLSTSMYGALPTIPPPAKVEKLKEKNKELRSEKSSLNSKQQRKQVVIQELRKTSKLSEAQIKCLLNRANHVQKWDLRSVVLPLIQMSISRKAYNFAVRTSVVSSTN